jgi:hypothetical protein
MLIIIFVDHRTASVCVTQNGRLDRTREGTVLGVVRRNEIRHTLTRLFGRAYHKVTIDTHWVQFKGTGSVSPKRDAGRPYVSGENVKNKREIFIRSPCYVDLQFELCVSDFVSSNHFAHGAFLLLQVSGGRADRSYTYTDAVQSERKIISTYWVFSVTSRVSLEIIHRHSVFCASIQFLFTNKFVKINIYIYIYYASSIPNSTNFDLHLIFRNVTLILRF